MSRDLALYFETLIVALQALPFISLLKTDLNALNPNLSIASKYTEINTAFGELVMLHNRVADNYVVKKDFPALPDNFFYNTKVKNLPVVNLPNTAGFSSQLNSVTTEIVNIIGNVSFTKAGDYENSKVYSIRSSAFDHLMTLFGLVAITKVILPDDGGHTSEAPQQPVLIPPPPAPEEI